MNERRKKETILSHISFNSIQAFCTNKYPCCTMNNNWKVVIKKENGFDCKRNYISQCDRVLMSVNSNQSLKPRLLYMCELVSENSLK